MSAALIKVASALFCLFEPSFVGVFSTQALSSLKNVLKPGYVLPVTVRSNWIT